MPKRRKKLVACEWTSVLGGQCESTGFGDPALCSKHERYRKLIEDDLDDESFDDQPITPQVVSAVFNVPIVQHLVGKISALIDKAGSLVDKASLGDISMQSPIKRGKGPPTVEARALFGFKPDQLLTEDMIKKRYHELAAHFHSDKGYTDRMMQIVNDARKELLTHVQK